ncbi:hypothetical protein ACT4VJ_12145 [Acinetobacter baumannii]|nr:hypothetical protein [Acinetobacter baumannii]
MQLLSNTPENRQKNMRLLKSILNKQQNKKANFSQLIREMPISTNEQNQLIKGISKKVKEICTEIEEAKKNNQELPSVKITYQLKFDNDPMPYTIIIQDTEIIPEYLYKSVTELTFKDILFMRQGNLHSKDEYVQIFTAVAITFYLIIECFLGEPSNLNLSLSELHTQLVQLMENQPGYSDFINNIGYRDDEHQTLYNLFLCTYGLQQTLKAYHLYYKLYILTEVKSRHQHLYNDVKHWEKEVGFYELKPAYKEVYGFLERLINDMIDRGLLVKYQVKGPDNIRPSICHDHSLLNNKKLLKSLHAKEFSEIGNTQKKAYYQEYADFLIHLITGDITLHRHQYSSLEQAYSTISDHYLTHLEKFIEERKQHHQHNLDIKPENYPQNIKKWLEEHFGKDKAKALFLKDNENHELSQ